MAGAGIPRHGYTVWSDEQQVGVVASGTQSPMLGVGIALGYVFPSCADSETQLSIAIRNRRVPATVVARPFYQAGKDAKTEEVMEFPKGLRYSREHEWVLVEEDAVTIGITDYAQEQLGDVVFVEFPELDTQLTKDEPFSVVESVKAVSDIYAPVSGRVTEVNTELTNSPETVNEDPYGDAWLVQIEISDPEELDSLMTAEDYEQFIEKEQEGDDD